MVASTLDVLEVRDAQQFDDNGKDTEWDNNDACYP
jgi:hypothetical protein